MTEAWELQLEYRVLTEGDLVDRLVPKKGKIENPEEFENRIGIYRAFVDYRRIRDARTGPLERFK